MISTALFVIFITRSVVLSVKRETILNRTAFGMELFLILLLALRTYSQKTPYEPYMCTGCQPEQIHIAFGDKSNTIVVTWSTFADTEESVVEYGDRLLDKSAKGSSKTFDDEETLLEPQWIHRVSLTNLKYNTSYIYHVGSRFGWSKVLYFHVPAKCCMFRAAIFGDLGLKNARSLPHLQQEAELGKLDLVVHLGDFAYDLHSNEGRVGNQFMRQMEPIAGVVPYMTCPGNHEHQSNYSHYKNRFSMPGDQQNMFYSWNLGPVHFISISTEFYYFLHYGTDMVINQYKWLMKDLIKATKYKTRINRPWIVLYGHRPMYCSRCDRNELIRTGLPGLGYSIEPLLMQYSVDLVFWGHEHNYERTWPVFDQKVYTSSFSEPYFNSKAPVHVITGAAGNQFKPDPFVQIPPGWSAFRNHNKYSCTRMTVYNKTHIHIEQVDVEKNHVFDSFWLTKDRHRYV